MFRSTIKDVVQSFTLRNSSFELILNDAVQLKYISLYKNTMDVNKVLCSLSCDAGTQITKELCVTAAEDNQENIKNSTPVLNIKISPCGDLDNIYLKPRRTKELLQSPLHREMFEEESKNVQTTPRCTHSGANMLCKGTKSIYSEPRRIKELLKSPWNRETSIATIRHGKEFKKILSEPRTKLTQKEPTKLPSNPKKLFQAPLKKEMENTQINPDQGKDLLESPLLRNLNIASEESKCLYSEPRRIRELLNSPLHRDMRSYFKFPDKESSQEVHSEPRRIKELLYSLDKDRPVKRKLQFDKKNLDKILERIEKHFQQLTAFKGVSKRSLQQMGVQYFIDIIEHLLSHTGIPMKPLDKSNYIEQTINAMKQLNYPHIVRKSWLLMPSASLQHVAQLLDFLLDFAPIKNNDFEFNFQTQIDKEEFERSAEKWINAKGENIVTIK